jgi:hypothetical protein
MVQPVEPDLKTSPAISQMDVAQVLDVEKYSDDLDGRHVHEGVFGEAEAVGNGAVDGSRKSVVVEVHVDLKPVVAGQRHVCTFQTF